MQQALTRISPQVSNIALGIAAQSVIGVLAQLVIFGMYSVFPSSDPTIAAAITTISTVTMLAVLIFGIWKKNYFFVLGIIFGYLMEMTRNFPFILGATS